MTPTDAVRLAGYIRAHFPSQPIDDYTADALGELLEPYSLADCRAAVLRLAMRNHEGEAGRPKWCSPTDVYAEVRRERAKRIAEAGDLTPPPGTEAEQRAWLRSARRAIGDGQTVDQLAAYGELKPRHLPDLRALMPAPDRTQEPTDA